MAEYDLDLDVIAPQSKKVKINGQIIEVHPPKFKSVVALINLADVVDKAGDNVDTRIVTEIKNALSPVIPQLNNDDFDITLEQMMKLLEFVLEIATPKDDKELVEAGYTPKQLNQKKTD